MILINTPMLRKQLSWLALLWKQPPLGIAPLTTCHDRRLLVLIVDRLVPSYIRSSASFLATGSLKCVAFVKSRLLCANVIRASLRPVNT
jgi:hypothetical protein